MFHNNKKNCDIMQRIESLEKVKKDLEYALALNQKNYDHLRNRCFDLEKDLKNTQKYWRYKLNCVENIALDILLSPSVIVK